MPDGCKEPLLEMPQNIDVRLGLAAPAFIIVEDDLLAASPLDAEGQVKNFAKPSVQLCGTCLSVQCPHRYRTGAWTSEHVRRRHAMRGLINAVISFFVHRIPLTQPYPHNVLSVFFRRRLGPIRGPLSIHYFALFP